jgi:hypothetical protein
MTGWYNPFGLVSLVQGTSGAAVFYCVKSGASELTDMVFLSGVLLGEKEGRRRGISAR